MHQDRLREMEFAKLRERAEHWLEKYGSMPLSLSMDHDARMLSKELGTYHIELELQNEDLRQAQAALEQSRYRYAALYNHAPVGYLTIGEDGTICETNFTASTLFGFAKRQLLGFPFVMFILAEDLPKYDHFRKKLLISSQKQQCDLRMKRDDGSHFHALLESKIDLDLDGNSGQFRIAITDISTLKILENGLQQSKDMWAKTFDALADAIIIFDGNHEVVRANSAAQAILAQHTSTAEEKSCPLARGLGLAGSCQQCPCQHKGSEAESQTVTSTLGPARTYHLTCAPLGHSTENAPLFFQIARDITPQKKMEEELLQSQKLEVIGTLAAGIAHDFNNILSAILGYADLVCATPEVPDGSKEHVKQIVLAGARAKDLIRQILTFSRKEQGEKMALDLTPIIKEAMKLLRASLPSTVEIQENITPDCGYVLANPINIHQVLVNLCTNAIHAMDSRKGVLTVALRRTSLPEARTGKEGAPLTPYVELMVSDTGVGMSREVQQRIFEPYFTTKNFDMGSGIGLAVVQGIVKGCGGLITVESEPGKGSTFKVLLPVLSEKSENIHDQQVPEQMVPLGNEHILFVDDETSIVTTSTLLLEQLGYRVTGLTSSDDALRHFKQQPEDFDLLITDQTMPGMTGVELSGMIHEMRPSVPVILCTGNRRNLPGDDSLTPGVVSVLSKPLGRLELAKAIRSALDR